jgi:pimeloyl-ACP methyl ester carboxylesterase
MIYRPPLLLAALCAALMASAETVRDAERAAVRLHIRKADTLLERYAPSAQRDAEARRELRRVTLRFDRALATPTPEPPPGFAEEAYVSPVDDSAQPFYRYLPSAWTPTDDNKARALPLIVYLHGYWSTLDLINWALFPDGLTNFAERAGACVAMPFGRSNTDFQGIGEQDVLRVVDLMHERYGTDTNRVVLMGISMGGMGTWTVGARFAERFNALLIISGRGDYDTWHRLEPGSLPSWERALVDAHFLSGQAPRLAGMPILAYHGALDPLVRPDEATALARPRTRRPAPAGWRPGEVPSRLQNAFLEPFLFVQATPHSPEGDAAFARRCAEWYAFAKAQPQRRHEGELSARDATGRNLFLFGEPESSPLVKRVLESAKVGIAPDAFDLQGRSVARAARGLWLAVPSPFAAGRTVVVNCGIPWGEALSPNHRYDMLPDLIVYTAEPGRIGVNRPDCAARVGDDGRFVWWNAVGR